MPCAFFLRPQCFSSDKPDQLIVDICTEGGAAKLFCVCVRTPEPGYSRLFDQRYNSREREGERERGGRKREKDKTNLVSAFQYNCLVGERTLEDPHTVFIAVFQHSTPSPSPHPSTTPEFNRFRLCVNILFYSRYETTLPKTNEAQPKSPLKLRGEKPEGKGSQYEWRRCGVFRVAEKISSWEKVETLRKCTLYPYLWRCAEATCLTERQLFFFVHSWILRVHGWGQWHLRVCVRARALTCEHFKFCGVFPSWESTKRCRKRLLLFSLFSGKPLLGKMPRQFRFQLLVHSPHLTPVPSYPTAFC